MRHTLFTFGVIWTLLLASVATAQTGTAIAGAVVARAGGRAVPDAVIAVDGSTVSATANASGRFRLEGLSAGTVTVVVRAPGFIEQRASVQVQPNQTTTLRIELETTPNFMDQIQVTATKSPLSIGDVAALTDVVGRATIEGRGDQTLTQAIAQCPA